MSWNPIYGLLLLGIIAATYLSAVMIEDIQMKETIINRSIMAASVGICLITLGVFKYSDFFLQNFHRILGLFHIQLTIPKFSLLLPVGISFYTEEKEPYDILFFGSSRVLDAFQPMELWEKYQIRSYNLAQHSEPLTMDYWELKNALEKQSANLVVFDISMFYGGFDFTNESDRAYLHKQLDHMTLSKVKIEAINQVVPKELRAEYLFPLILYHSRWNEITTVDFKKQRDVGMGAEVRWNVMPQEKIPWLEE